MKPHLGDWYIGRVNLVLAGVQLLIWLQTGSRGLDYVQRRPPMPTPRALLVIEQTLPLPVWGTGFLIAAGVLFVGVAGRWWPVVVAGHVGSAVMYGCFTAGSWIQVPMFSVLLAVGGGIVLAGGVYLAVVTSRHDWGRFAGAIVLTGAGGWACGIGMGYDFRTTTGFLVITLVHCLYAVGITWIASQRDDLKVTG